MILGTHTSESEPNYLMIAQALLPLDHAEFDFPDADGFGFANTNKVKITEYINHDGEVNRACYMPQNPLIIATKAVSGEVHVFDYSRHASEPTSNGECNPDLSLRRHNEKGFRLSWSKLKQGHLLSGSNDTQICLWDINASPHNKTLEAMLMFKVHEGFVEDLAWHMRQENLFGSVVDDRYLYIWDLRSQSANKPVQSVLAHQSEVHLKDNSRHTEECHWINAVKLFDLRKINAALHTINSHEIDEEQTAEDAKDGPPELLFIHGGHTSKISDFSCNPNEEWVVASVAEDNIPQIWQMAENIYHDEDDVPEESTKPAA